MFTQLFWKDTIERVVSTAAQAALGVLTADNLTGLANIDFKAGLSIVGGAAVASFLKALIAGKYASNNVSPASLAD